MARSNKTTTAAQAETIQMSVAHKVAHELFAANKVLNEVHVTSDGMAFYLKSDANNHACILKDKAVISVKRSDLTATTIKAEKPTPAPVTDGEGGNDDGSKDDNPDKE